MVPDRSRRVVVLAHCHLNVTTKVHGLASYPGARADVVGPLLDRGVGIVQLPCPEATYLGMRRWAMTREQYDTRSYRRHCRRILRGTVDTLVALADDGCAIEAVIGVDGSPSCGVSVTCTGYEGGVLTCDATVTKADITEGRGVFMDVLTQLLDEAGLSIPLKAVDERHEHGATTKKGIA